jgi:DNA polymerase-3 subunit gamma/tau
VELTLIEIAQITQPDDTPASGRKPRRLKSLFKQLMQKPQPRQAASQVAAAEPVASTQNETNTTSEPKPTTEKKPATTAYTPTARPHLKSPVGFSWNNLRKTENPKKMHIIPGTLDPNDPNVTNQEEQESFSQQDLELQWMLMCNRMPQEFSGIATRMKNMNPVITEFPAVELVVDNQLAATQIEDIKGKILSTLQIYLHNKSITLSVRIAKHQEKRILSRREQYEEMEKENPSIGKLRELLDLQLA